jgi:hypothetical protein
MQRMARDFGVARRTFQNLLKSLAVRRRRLTDSAPNLSKLGHLTDLIPS